MRAVAALLCAGVLAGGCNSKSHSTSDTQPPCKPKVCTPCDCGQVSDGCGGTLSCGACPTPKRCTETYGAVEGFRLCSETDGECSFGARQNSTRSCREVCEAHRGTCLSAYRSGPGSCEKSAPQDLGCEARSENDEICVCTRKTSDYSPLPCPRDLSTGPRESGLPLDSTGAVGDRSVSPADKPASKDTPAPGKLLYRVTFESGSIAAVVGKSSAETMAGGTVTAVANPKKDAVNGSSSVGRHKVPSGYTRAELSSQRLVTVDRTYTFKWSYYIPASFFSNTITWDLISQWKTYPCGDHNGWDKQICGSCGIFNGLVVTQSGGFEFRYRAEPDCYNATASLMTGQWIRFVMQVKWTNAQTGFVKLWRNGQLLYDKAGIKTLFDNFQPGTCDLYWAVGVYSENQGGLELFTDDIEIWEGAVS